MKRFFAIINLLVAAAVPVLVIVLANAYSESPFGNAPQMFLVMAIGLGWAILNLGLGLRERFRGAPGRSFAVVALLAVSPILYFIAWNLFFRK